MKIDGRLFVAVMITLVLIPGACATTIGGGPSISSSGFAQGDSIASGAQVAGYTVANGILSDTENHWVEDTTGKHVEVGISVDSAAKMSYSYSLIPNKDKTIILARSSLTAQESLDVTNAKEIQANANARNGEGDQAYTVVHIWGGSLKGYKNSATAKMTSATALESARSASGDKIWLVEWAGNYEGDWVGKYALPWAPWDIENGRITNFVGSATATKSSVTRSETIASISGSIPWMGPQALNEENDVARGHIVTPPGTSLSGYENTAYANKAGTRVTQSITGASGPIVVTSEAWWNTQDNLVYADLSLQSGSLNGYSDSASATSGTSTASQGGHITGAFTSTASDLPGAAKIIRTSNYGTDYDLNMQTTKDSSGSTASGTLGYYVDINNPSANKIQGAVDAAWPGDTINVAAGKYLENILINKLLTLRGSGRGNNAATNTIIEAQQKDQPVIRITAGGTSTANRLIVQNLQVTGANIAMYPWHYGAGISINGPASYITLDKVASKGNVVGLEINAHDSADIFDVNANGIVITDSQWAGATAAANDGGRISKINLNNAKISNCGSYGGVYLWTGDSDGSPGSSMVSDISLNNAEISNIKGAGICARALYGSTISGISMIGGSVTGSQGSGLYADGNVANVVINRANIYGNAAGIFSENNNNIIDARNVWWGDASGPYNPTSNPSGTGNSVSNNVQFKPWRRIPY